MRAFRMIGMASAMLVGFGCQPDSADLSPSEAEGNGGVKVHKVSEPAEATPVAGSPTEAPVHGAASQGGQLPPGHPPIQGRGNARPKALNHEPPARSATPIEGEVVERLVAGRYQILKVRSQGKELWAATPAGASKVGDRVRISDASSHRDFHSTSLKRTFDEIWFGRIAGKPAPKAPTPPVRPPVTATSAKAPTIGSGQKSTVAGIWALDRKAAKGKVITVTGKVVKFNAAVLNRNWLHIQDGSGAKAQGNHDLTVTTAVSVPPVAVGSTVTATGVLSVARDFGHGYRYEILLESATLSAGGAP